MYYRESKRRGQILILFTLFVGFLMGFSAIAFDLAYTMVMRAQLVTALDAATMAAIRFVPQGTTAMDAAARRTFDANLPSGKLLALNPTLSAPTVTNDTGAVRVQYSATVDAPLFFARWFGRDKLTITAATTAARRDRNIVLVLDYSGSVQPVLADIKTASKAFVNSFSETTDQVGLAVFSTSGRLAYAPQKPFKADLDAAIEGISDEMFTNHAAGLYYAYLALLNLDDPLKAAKMNEIVFFTDGEANWFPGQFNVSVGGGSNQCLSTPVDGVFGWGAGGNNYKRVLRMPAPPNSATPSAAPQCPNWAPGQNALISMRPTWIPPGPFSNPTALSAGIPLAGFKNQNPNLNDTSLTEAEAGPIAKNVVDNLARAIRKEPTLQVRIHTIGYNGTGGTDQDVLERLANCDGCPSVDPIDAADAAQAKGLYVAASNSAELMQAFLDIAGFIGRLVE